MDRSSIKFRVTFIAFSVFILSLLAMSCENKIPVIPKSDLLTLPSNSAKDFTTTLTDSGKTQLILSAPIMESFDKVDPPYSEFRSGIKVDLYNGKDHTVATVTSHYAKCTSRNLWELRDSVVVINENNEKLETELLFWNQEKDKIYTDRFVKITSENEDIQGIGFESDSHLSKRKILKVTANLYPKDEK
jgi:LPS export ABC transporter protein LptC